MPIETVELNSSELPNTSNLCLLEVNECVDIVSSNNYLNI